MIPAATAIVAGDFLSLRRASGPRTASEPVTMAPAAAPMATWLVTTRPASISGPERGLWMIARWATTAAAMVAALPARSILRRAATCSGVIGFPPRDLSAACSIASCGTAVIAT